MEDGGGPGIGAELQGGCTEARRGEVELVVKVLEGKDIA